MILSPAPILSFWFGDSLEQGWPAQSRNKLWFRADAAVDAEIEDRFGALVEQALMGELVEWEAKPLSRLALIILLDQFPRNIWRGTARAFAGDHRAVTLTSEGLATGMAEKLPWIGQVFFCMPLMHAEDIDLQNLSVDCFRRMVSSAPPEIAGGLRDNLDFAIEHRDIIQRFGRFPYRNNVLGRSNTPDERVYLVDGARYGQ